MSKKKKKASGNKGVQQQNMTPIQYIKSGRARKLPIFECIINSEWKEQGIASVVVTRKHSTGNVTFGFYLVDVFCLGIKNADVGFNLDEEGYQEFLENMTTRHEGIEKIDYTLAHNIIFGALAYAEDLGFKPHKDWEFAQMVLEEDTEDIELIDIEFGKDGKPCYISGPYDKKAAIIEKLKKSVGEGNFEVILLDDYQDYGNLDISDVFEVEEDDETDDTQDVEFEEVK